MRQVSVLRSALRAALALALVVAPQASAWKVTTHMVVVTKAAARVEDSALREILLSNLDSLRAGAAGPDLFYFPYVLPSAFGEYPAYADPHWVLNTKFSDRAHYCSTNVLALNMISLAGNEPSSPW